MTKVSSDTLKMVIHSFEWPYTNIVLSLICAICKYVCTFVSEVAGGQTHAH